VLTFLLAFVVPKVTAVLLAEKRALPWPTEFLLASSNFVTDRWWVVLPAALGILLAGERFRRAKAGRRIVDRVLLLVPRLGNLYRKQAVARWAGTMAPLLTSGIPVAQALSVVRGTAGSVLLADDVARLEREVVEGSSLSESLKRSRLLPSS